MIFMAIAKDEKWWEKISLSTFLDDNWTLKEKNQFVAKFWTSKEKYHVQIDDIDFADKNFMRLDFSTDNEKWKKYI